MVDWLAANLRQRAAYDAICRAERGRVVITADAEVACRVSRGIVGAGLELLSAGIEAGIAGPPVEREALLNRLIDGVVDVAVDALPGLSLASAA